MSALMPSTLANGRYQLSELVGHGGMAEVYKALDTRLNRTVAVKIMRSDLAIDPIFIARFAREAQSVARMNNPNIVSIYDSGDEMLTVENGQTERVPYLVMEYVKGQTLRDIIKANGPLSQRDAEQVMLGVLNALDYSHRMGIIHRDIKPGNIMISEAGMVKVMDFGIARVLDDSAATMTQSQGVVGTAQYLSPEQARGESVDARSDLYSAGCVLYEMLTGKPPFTGDSAVAIAYQHVSEVATPPSTLVPGLPSMWDSICAKAMAKDRLNRYATAAEFKNDVLTFMNGGTPVAAAFNPLTDLSNIRTRKAAETAETTAMPAATTTMAMPPAADTAAPTQAFNPATGQFETIAPSNAAVTGTLPATRSAQRAAEATKKKKRNTIIGLVVGLLVLAGIVFGAWTFMTRDKTEYVSVPTISSSMTEEMVRKTLANAGLQLDKQEDTDSTQPAGTPTKQDPAGGAQAAKGSAVKVWFSTGPQSVQVPAGLEGLTQSAAQEKLKAAGFTINPSNKTEDSATIGKDLVTRTDPASGQSATKGSQITIYTSNGMTTVPDWTNKTQSDVESERSSNYPKFQLTIREEASDTVAQGSVTRTSPAAGQKVSQDAAVTVYISTGKQQVSVPSVVGFTLAQAKAQLGDFQVSVSGPQDDDAEVTAQNPTPGQQVDKGSTITLTTEAASVTVPSVVGQTYAQARSRLESAGFTVKTTGGNASDSAKVTSQSPGAGQSATKGGTITLTLSGGGSTASPSTSKD